MKKKEFLSRWTVLQPIYEVKNGETVKHTMEDDLDEYGKYCSQKAWQEVLIGEFDFSFTDWWNKFKAKEDE